MKITKNSNLSETRGGFVDRTGARYGTFTVLKRLGNDNNGHIYWECRCDCGKVQPVSVSNLAVTSCKCATAHSGTQLTLF